MSRENFITVIWLGPIYCGVGVYLGGIYPQNVTHLAAESRNKHTPLLMNTSIKNEQAKQITITDISNSSICIRYIKCSAYHVHEKRSHQMFR